MKKGILILIIIILLTLLFIIISSLINRGCEKNNFGCFYSAIEENCRQEQMVVERTNAFIDTLDVKTTKRFLFTLNKLPDEKCNFKMKVLEYTDPYSQNKEFKDWLIGKESTCVFEEEELIKMVKEFEKYAHFEVPVLDGIKQALKENCEGAYAISFNAARFKKDSAISIPEDATCIDNWCFQEVS